MANNLKNNIGVRSLDAYLKFIQQNFNISPGYSDIVKWLNYVASENSYIMDARNESNRARAQYLLDHANDIELVFDTDKYNKFNKLGDLNLSNKGLINTYSVAEEIIGDIHRARNWLNSYRELQHRFRNSTENLHEELVYLGKSILGRAVELTPMDTGTLRRSGVMLDFGTYIIVGFTAPYASYVHENMEIAHPLHGGRNCGGEAKFLEKAVQEFFPDRRVWVEISTSDSGDSGAVFVKIGINPDIVEYHHYDA